MRSLFGVLLWSLASIGLTQLTITEETAGYFPGRIQRQNASHVKSGRAPLPSPTLSDCPAACLSKLTVRPQKYGHPLYPRWTSHITRTHTESQACRPALKGNTTLDPCSLPPTPRRLFCIDCEGRRFALSLAEEVCVALAPLSLFVSYFVKLRSLALEGEQSIEGNVARRIDLTPKRNVLLPTDLQHPLHRMQTAVRDATRMLARASGRGSADT